MPSKKKKSSSSLSSKDGNNGNKDEKGGGGPSSDDRGIQFGTGVAYDDAYGASGGGDGEEYVSELPTAAEEEDAEDKSSLFGSDISLGRNELSPEDMQIYLGKMMKTGVESSVVNHSCHHQALMAPREMFNHLFDLRGPQQPKTP